MNNDELLALAAAKSAAHNGLADALDYGRVRALRINGVDHVFADGFDVAFDSFGNAHCAGYVVNSTCRDLARDALVRCRA